MEGRMLRDKVEDFIAHSADPRELHDLLNQCVEDRTVEGIACVRRLFESDYGGFMFNFELKAPSASTLVVWGKVGIQALFDATLADRTSMNISLCVQTLSSVAAGSALSQLSFVRDAALVDRIKAALVSEPKLPDFCRARLVDLVLSMETDDDVASLGGRLSSLVFSEDGAAKELFAALSARWLAVSKPVLEQFEKLIVDKPNDESAFQRFLAEHPQLLDPMAVTVWPQPNLLGSRFPDYVIRRADDSYLIVEIECPSKILVTSGGQLSAEETHAEQQAMDYRSYLMRRYADARLHFPNFDDPECLVVVGLERALDERQKAVLRDANRHRHRLRIVGFDWLSYRARTIAGNITRHHVEVIDLRIT
jgi:hypothetical protein